MNIAVITGASSGLGREFAIQIDEMYFHNKKHPLDEIWLIARRREKLVYLKPFLHTKARIISMDVTDDLAMSQYAELLEKNHPNIRLLVNCAGYGLLGQFRDLDIQEQLGMIDVNCTALTRMTHICIPYMGKGSHMIQLASSAAFLPQPNFAIYAATKAYVLSLSHALAEELRKDKIYVTAVCPGPVHTDFFQTAEKHGSNMAVKKLTMVEAPGVVRAALKASYHKHLQKTVSVYSLPIQLFHLITKIVPTKLILIILRTIK